MTTAYLALSLAALVGYFTLGDVLAAACYVGMSALALAAVAVGVRMHRPRLTRPWLVIAAAQAAFLVADILWYHNALTNPLAVDQPGASDVLYLAGYPLLAIGLIMFIRARQRHYRLTAAIDAILIGVAAVLALWLLVIDNVIRDETIPVVERLITVAYPIGDAAVLAAAAYLLLTGRQGRRSLYLLLGSLAALLVGDLLQATVDTGASMGAAADAFWMVSYVLFGLAALDPSMRQLVEPGEALTAPDSNRRLLLIGVAISALPAFALYQRFFEDQMDLALIGVCGVVVMTAIMLRMHELGAVLGRSERRYASLLANASEAFAIMRRDGSFTYVSPASERVLGYGSDETIRRGALDLIHPRARSRAATRLRRVMARPGAQSEFELQARRADGEWRWLSVTATNRTDDPLIDGIVLNYRDITERKQLEERLVQQAFTDGLTGLSNRPLFIDRVSQVLARRRRNEGQMAVSVLFIDVDDFKTVNDSLGHSSGDRLLVALAGRLKATVRPADTAARLGGDEFAVLLENTDAPEAERVAARLLASLAMPERIAEFDVSVSVSIGIAVDRAGGADTVEELLRDADLAMYTAKSKEPGSYAVYEPTMHAAALRRLEAKADHQPDARRVRTTTTWTPVAGPGSRAATAGAVG